MANWSSNLHKRNTKNNKFTSPKSNIHERKIDINACLSFAKPTKRGRIVKYTDTTVSTIELPADFSHRDLAHLRQQVRHDVNRILIDAARLKHVDSEKLGVLVMAFPPSSETLPISIINARYEIKGILQAAMMDGYFIVN